jgi:hypothetical protein
MSASLQFNPRLVGLDLFLIVAQITAMFYNKFTAMFCNKFHFTAPWPQPLEQGQQQTTRQFERKIIAWFQ